MLRLVVVSIASLIRRLSSRVIRPGGANTP
jgi:hypothetical protein